MFDDNHPDLNFYFGTAAHPLASLQAGRVCSQRSKREIVACRARRSGAGVSVRHWANAALGRCCWPEWPQRAALLQSIVIMRCVRLCACGRPRHRRTLHGRSMPMAAAGSAKLLLAPMLRHERLTAVLPLHSATAVLAGRLTVKIHWEEPRPVHRTTHAATASFAHTHTRTGVRLDGSFVCTCGRLSNARFCFAATRNPSTCAGSKASMKRSHGCGAC